MRGRKGTAETKKTRKRRGKDDARWFKERSRKKETESVHFGDIDKGARLRNSLFCDKRGEGDRRKGLELIGREFSSGLISPGIRVFGFTRSTRSSGNCRKVKDRGQ